MRKRFSAKAAGIIFGLGLGVSGMTSQAPVEVFDMHPAFPFPTRPICGGQSAELPRCCWLLGSFLGLRHGMWHHGVISSLLHGGLHGSMLAEPFFARLLNQTSPFCSGSCGTLCRRKRKMQSHGASSRLRSRAKRVTMKLCCSRAQS